MKQVSVRGNLFGKVNCSVISSDDSFVVGGARFMIFSFFIKNGDIVDIENWGSVM